jgi:hypothetical protein
MVRTSVFVDKELIDWGKRRPGGLSATVRRLLREEKRRAESGTAE